MNAKIREGHDLTQFNILGELVGGHENASVDHEFNRLLHLTNTLDDEFGRLDLHTLYNSAGRQDLTNTLDDEFHRLDMHTMYNSAARQDLLKHGKDASTNEIRDDEQLVDLLCTLISENEQVKENVAVVDEEERSEGGSTDKEYERKIVKNRNKKRIVVEDTTADSRLGPNDIRRYLDKQSIKTEMWS